MKTPGLASFGEPISECIGVSHDTYNGRADWYFVCIIRGTERKVSPLHVRHDPKDEVASATYRRMSKFLSDYLTSNGRWLNPPGKALDGAAIHWQPIKPEGRSKKL